MLNLYNHQYMTIQGHSSYIWDKSGISANIKKYLGPAIKRFFKCGLGLGNNRIYTQCNARPASGHLTHTGGGLAEDPT